MSGPPPPPPPCPPPPPPGPPPRSTSVPDTSDQAGALFAEINSLGESGIRGGLKKATRGPVNESIPDVAPKRLQAPVKKVAPTGNPICELQGKKWIVENQNGNKEISIEANMKQTLYAFKCHDSLLKIDGKINAIVLDSCTKTACIFEEAMASVEIVNSKDIQIQCTKSAPAMSIDGCTAVTYYMSPSYASSQIITAKSAAVNLIRPTDDDDIIETPIPEQFCTTWQDGNWVTEAVSHDD